MKRATPLDPDAPTVGRQNGATAPVAAAAPDWMLGSVGVPRAFRGATFATKATLALRHARAYLDAGGVEDGRLLGLGGPVGVGKTWGVAAIVNDTLAVNGHYLFEHERHPAWFTCAALVREVRSFQTARDAIERVKRATLLVVDDLEVPDAVARDVLDEVFSLRHAEALATVFTTNLTTAELAGVLSDHVLDRLRAWGVIHEVTGQSLRGGAA